MLRDPGPTLDVFKVSRAMNPSKHGTSDGDRETLLFFGRKLSRRRSFGCKGEGVIFVSSYVTLV